jgi:hypothetical protein
MGEFLLRSFGHDGFRNLAFPSARQIQRKLRVTEPGRSRADHERERDQIVRISTLLRLDVDLRLFNYNRARLLAQRIHNRIVDFPSGLSPGLTAHEPRPDQNSSFNVGFE